VDIPRRMTWLDNKTILVCDRKGELRVISDGKLLSEKVSGLPELRAQGQCGLLDVAFDPNYAINHQV
jgi:glucose/arabinose dehydrogenase